VSGADVVGVAGADVVGVAGADVVGVAGAGASLRGGDDAEDNCSGLLEFDGGRARTCAPAVVRGVATRLEDGRGERPV
jgi:hypothetical protein